MQGTGSISHIFYALCFRYMDAAALPVIFHRKIIYQIKIIFSVCRFLSNELTVPSRYNHVFSFQMLPGACRKFWQRCQKNFIEIPKISSPKNKFKLTTFFKKCVSPKGSSGHVEYGFDNPAENVLLNVWKSFAQNAQKLQTFQIFYRSSSPKCSYI